LCFERPGERSERPRECNINRPERPIAKAVFNGREREICVFACRNAQVISIPVGTKSEIRMVLLEALGAVASPAGVQPAKERFHEDEEEQG